MSSWWCLGAWLWTGGGEGGNLSRGWPCVMSLSYNNNNNTNNPTPQIGYDCNSDKDLISEIILFLHMQKGTPTWLHVFTQMNASAFLISLIVVIYQGEWLPCQQINKQITKQPHFVHLKVLKAITEPWLNFELWHCNAQKPC